MSKIKDFMQKHGRDLKPAKEPKDGKKLTKKEIEALTIQALTDLGYIKMIQVIALTALAFWLIISIVMYPEWNKKINKDLNI